MSRIRVINVALLVVAVTLFVMLFAGVMRRTAVGQMVFQAGPVLVCSGHESGGNVERPLYLLDTTTQALIVYVYQPQQNYLRLMAVRKVLDDLDVREFNMGGKPQGPTVEQIKSRLEKMRSK